MIKGFKVRLNPNNKQLTMLFKSAGTARFIYNWTLEKQQENYEQGGKFISDRDLRKEITILKKTELKWLEEVSNNVAKQSVKDACNAYKKFFGGMSKYPKLKSKKRNKPSFYNDVFKIKVQENHVRLEKIGWIRLSEHNRIPYGKNVKYLNPRITFDGVHWYVSLNVEIPKENQPELTGETIGIDLVIKKLAIISDGSFYKNINKCSKVRKTKKSLKRFQRQVSKKYEMNKQGKKYVKTNNIRKLEKKIRVLQIRLNNIRNDYKQKITTMIVKTKPSRVVMEDLNVGGMMKNKHLSRAIQEQGFYEFQSMMGYKCQNNGIEFVLADRWYPSSKICSCCGNIKKKLSLSDRTYICEKCGLKIDRDYNASINLSTYKVS